MAGSSKNLTVRLNTERYEALRAEAETMGMSINSLVVQIVDEHFISPQAVTRSSLLRSTYAGSSPTSSNIGQIQSTFQEGISRLTDAYEDALRKLGGDEGGS